MRRIRAKCIQLLIYSVLLSGLLGAVLWHSATAQTTGPVTASIAPFPRTYQLSNGGSVTLFEPQVASWAGQTHMAVWCAVSYQAKPGEGPVVGSIKIEADTEIALSERLVRFREFTIPEVNLSSLSREDAQMITTSLKAALPDEDRILPLDKVFAAVEKSQLTSDTRNPKEIKADPPAIFYSAADAILVAFDGEPVWSPITGLDVKFAVNTNWDILQQPSTNTYFLRNGSVWYRSGDLKSGWAPAGPLPESFSRLPADGNWKEVLASLPGKAVSSGKVPQIFVSTAPAELIVTAGAPKYTPVAGSSLLWLSNTESDLFRNGASGEFYYLVAGRWFSAPDLSGPWKFATPDLPADFQKIPVEHPRSRVLASIPGTQQATEAVVQATVKTTARVSRSQLRPPDVTYQGDPVYEPIENSSLLRAVNTDKDIVFLRGVYYMCYDGVWFTSASPKEYWTVATEVPSEIYHIPASSPAHKLSYVTVSDDDPGDDWVTESYEPGYTGTEVAWGVPVWGTGWYYPPYVYYGSYYPIYYPYYPTYGLAAWYNPYLGVFGRGALAYGPYGGAGFAAAWNPLGGGYLRGSSVYAGYSSTTFAQAYRPRTGTYAQTRQSSNLYGNWGSSYVQRGDNWARTAGTYNYRNGNSNGAIQTGRGTQAVTRDGRRGQTTIAKTADGQIFAGHDGRVYRQHGNGFQRYDNSGRWVNSTGEQVIRDPGNRVPTAPPVRAGARIDGSTYNQLNRDAAARREGAQRAEALRNYRSSMGGRAAAGSFRGGGGGRR